jgi:hypothetical protein
MARTTRRPNPTSTRTLLPLTRSCPACGERLSLDYYNRRTVTTLDQVVRLRLGIRRCPQSTCTRYHKPLRPEAEGHMALPHHEFGLDVLAHIGNLRYRQQRTGAEIHHDLVTRGMVLAQRSVTNLLDRYDELLAVSASDPARLHPLLRDEGRVILAIDGLQPDVGHEVLWVVRDCLSGEILWAQALLSSATDDLAQLLRHATTRLPVPVVAVVSDGQPTIRGAVAQVLPGVAHQLCQFHFLREAGTPIYEMDRHAKKELKKTVRAVRVVERQVEARTGLRAEAVMGYCQAVRSALTDDGRPPLDDKGLLLHTRLDQIATSIERVTQKGGHRANWSACVV